MIKLSYNEIVAAITEKAKLPQKDIEERIQNKLTQLSGLISREGAAHIVAHELGVKLFEQFTGQLKIKNIMPGIRSVETIGKVLQVYDIREFKTEKREGKVGSMLIGDETGSIRIVLWGESAEKLRSIKLNSIVKVRNGYVRENTGRLEVHLNDNSHLLTEIKDVAINIPDSNGSNGASRQYAKQSPRKSIKDLSEQDADAELFATIVQVFDLKFFEVCGMCNKRVRLSDNFTCPEHGPVQPGFAFLLNFVIDDGTENIRAVCFRSQVEQLLQKSSAEILAMKDQPDLFEISKASLLGTTAKFRGRCTRNQFFNRLEFVVNSATQAIDLEKEIQEFGAIPVKDISIPIKRKSPETGDMDDAAVPEETVY
ncbi:hypothetical protein HYV81_03760 [Candidatus Woesearchaeota archaeon]|nr:hypothetical protein [Candidatus Woesearchaeota archaeon]